MMQDDKLNIKVNIIYLTLQNWIKNW